MGQLTQTTAQVQVILDDADAANVGKTSLTDSTDTTAVAVRKSGFYSLGAASSNAPSTDRAILISAVRDTTATGEIRYGQVAITESNGMWWNRDDGGTLGTWYEAVSTAGTQTLTNKTLTSPVLTTPQINDTSANHQYVFAVSELAADRTVTLPLLTGNDTFVFEAHTQTLTNKTLTSPVFNTGVSGTAVLDDDSFLTASSTTLATSESIKAYVDATVTGEDLDFAGDSGTGAVDLDSQTFTIAGTANEIETAASSQTLTIGLPDSVTITTALSVDTINEKTAAAGVTVDSLLIKDGGITAAGTSTFAGQTISDLGTVTTANIDGGSIDGTTIGASTAAAITGTTITATTGIDVTGTAVIETGSGNTYPAASTSADNLVISDKTASTPVGITIFSDNASQGNIFFGDENDADNGRIVYDHNGNANTMSFYANGAERLAIDSSGIDVTGTVTADRGAIYSGVLSEQSQLRLGYSSDYHWSFGRENATTGDLFIESSVTGTDTTRLKVGANGDISFYEDTGTTAKFFWDASAESLGIGTSSPSQKLTVEGSAGYLTTIQTSDANKPRLQVYIDDTDGVSLVSGYDTTAKGMQFFTGGLNRLRIDSSGNLGLGVTPSAWGANNTALQIRSSGFVQQDNATNVGLGRNAVQDGAWSYIANGYAQMLNLESDGAFKFFQAGSGTAGNTISFSQAMTLDASGNLLVGTSSQLGAGSYGLHEIRGDNSSGGASALVVYNSNAADSATAVNAIKNSATTTSSQRFIQFYCNAGATAMGGIVGNGASNAQFATLSDVREKTNIQSIAGSLDKINALNPVEFDWIASGEHINAGFVAQEVEQVFPEFVVENMADEGAEERKGLTGGMTGGIVAHLVKAIQEQNELINDLRARVAQLEGAN